MGVAGYTGIDILVHLLSVKETSIIISPLSIKGLKFEALLKLRKMCYCHNAVVEDLFHFFLFHSMNNLYLRKGHRNTIE